MTTTKATEPDRERWNRKYADREGPVHFRPSPLLVQYRHLIAQTVRDAVPPPSATSSGPSALDVACGFGGNSMYLASLGYQVDAVDISEVALTGAQEEAKRRGLQLRLVQADLNHWWIPPSRYALIVMTYYLNRGLISQLTKGLRAGGLLLVETHNMRYLSTRPQFNPVFLLQLGELRRLPLEAGLDVVHVADGMPEPHTSQLVARRPIED